MDGSAYSKLDLRGWWILPLVVLLIGVAVGYGCARYAPSIDVDVTWESER